MYYPIGSDPEGIAIGDVNSDGKLDLVSANQGDNSITVLLGNGDGTFQPGSTFPTGPSPHGIVIVDLNNDGQQDVATADQSQPGKVSVLLNAAMELSRPTTNYRQPAILQPQLRATISTLTGTET